LKSSNNYGHLVQLRKRYAEFRDPSCSGAETEDMTQTQNVSPGPNPPQFDSLSADNVLVTLQIGGNDIVNYSAIFPHTGNGCYPQMPVARGDVAYLRAKQQELNAILAQQAQANGAGIVDAAPLHPNLLGMRAMADMISPLSP
jgi:lysophospholipase L1-like esterase